MRPKPKVVASEQSQQTRQLRSDPGLQRGIAASLEPPSSRKARAEPPAEDEPSRPSRQRSRRPPPPPPRLMSVGDAVDGHYGDDEDELWWPATVP